MYKIEINGLVHGLKAEYRNNFHPVFQLNHSLTNTRDGKTIKFTEHFLA